MSENSQVLKPVPRRTFDFTPASTPSLPPSPSPESTNAELLEAKLQGTSPPSRTRSVLHLTSSTLLGIYSPTGYDGLREELSTPWGTGAQTPSLKPSVEDQASDSMPVSWDQPLPRVASDRRRTGFRRLYLPLLLRAVVLFVIGIAYGTIITHLHDNQKLAPVKVDAFDRSSWSYLILWGLVGVAIGNLQPWLDSAWSESNTFLERPRSPIRRRGSASSGDADDTTRPTIPGDWTLVIRSIGAFVGIAFAIRKLPWQSTMQVSVTLALVNPVLWYLIDRSKSGFILSTVVGIAGTFVLLEINPNIVPSPAIQPPRVTTANDLTTPTGGADRFISHESIGVWTWIASVLFCSCVCFGNIGRRLALGQQQQQHHSTVS